MSSLPEIVEGMAAALEPLTVAVPDLQIYPYLNTNPTPPSLDIYPGDPFQEPEGFSKSKRLFFTVRARASTADPDAGQQALLQLLEPDGPSSVETALCWDGLGGLVDSVTIAAESPSGYRVYQDPGGNGSMVGCEWRVEVLT